MKLPKFPFWVQIFINDDDRPYQFEVSDYTADDPREPAGAEELFLGEDIRVMAENVGDDRVLDTITMDEFEHRYRDSIGELIEPVSGLIEADIIQAMHDRYSCEGHPDNLDGPGGVTEYCDGSCR